MNYVDKLSMSNTLKYIKKKYTTYNSELPQLNILEPLSVLFKLSLLIYKPDGTKISITNNILNIQEPYFTQGLSRYLNNDKKEDLSKLYIPIMKGLERTKEYNNIDMDYLINLSKDGLIKLKQCYNNVNNINVIIDSYISLLSNYLTNKEIIIKDDDIKCKFFYNIWSENDITIINNYFKLLDESKDNHIRLGYITIIEKIINLKELVALDIINKAYQFF